jgi:hypothetical protein
MACSRGRVDAESDFEVFQSVSCICRQYRNYRLLAWSAPYYHLVTCCCYRVLEQMAQRLHMEKS